MLGTGLVRSVVGGRDAGEREGEDRECGGDETHAAASCCLIGAPPPGLEAGGYSAIRSISTLFQRSGWNHTNTPERPFAENHFGEKFPSAKRGPTPSGAS